MNLRKALAAGVGVVAAATMLFAAPAHADQTGNTTVTFNLQNGSLAVQVLGSTASTAATASLGTVTPDAVTSQISGNLLSTTVTDSRNSLTGYTVSGNCDNFTDGGSNSIPKANATISIPAVSAGTLGGTTLTGSTSTTLSQFFVPTPGTACGTSAGSLGTRETLTTTILTTLGVLSADNTVTYTPHIVVTIPASTPNATYSSTVYQTAA